MSAGEAFRGKSVLVTFAKTKVTRGRRGRSTPLVCVAEGDATLAYNAHPHRMAK